MRPGTVPDAHRVAASEFVRPFGDETRVAYQRAILSWWEYLRGIAVAPVEAVGSHVEEWAYRDWGFGPPAARTVTVRLAALAGYYERLIRDGLTSENPVLVARRPEPAPYLSDVPSRAELGVLQEAAHRLDVEGRQRPRLTLTLLIQGFNVAEVARQIGADRWAVQRDIAALVRMAGTRPITPRDLRRVARFVEWAQMGDWSQRDRVEV